VLRSRIRPSRGPKSVLVKSLGKIDECFQAKTNSAGFVILPVLFTYKRSGDIEMCPRRVFRNKFLEEKAGSECAGNRSADVVDVGVWRFQQVLIFLRKRQFPKRLALILSRLDHRLDQLWIVAHNSRHAESQRSNACAGQGSDVKNMRRLLFACK